MFSLSAKPFHHCVCLCVCVCVFLSACVCAGTFSEEHEELRRLHSCRSEEQEGAALELRGRLRNAQDELDQVRSALRSLEGADGHGESLN